jgi:hypothetical protein
MEDQDCRQETVFVSIAAYRDPELLPTITDCIAKARHPDRLRFGVCWQYASEEQGSELLREPQFTVRYVDWRLSQGACWARAEIMKLYRGEDWYLQLDSHHRFAADWDAKLINQAAATGSSRPVLTTYADAFTPGAETGSGTVTSMEFDYFTADGLPMFRPVHVATPPAEPVRARFVSAHFLFAPGSFVEDVPYDPELYFHGEEITLAVRAFTHGYDLFHPGEHILWHEYTRAGRSKHWEDHTAERGVRVSWHDRDALSLAKAARLLTQPWLGRDGMGTERTPAEYEAYAGLSFRRRQVQHYTRLNREPPNPPAREDWARWVKDRRVEIRLSCGELPSAALEDPSFWYVGVHNDADEEIFRQDAQPAELVVHDGQLTIVREFSSDQEPVTWTVIPYSASRGWLDRVSGSARAGQRILVSVASYRDPALVPTVADCLAKARFPQDLRFVVCWQHGADEQLPDWMREPQFRILDVDARHSRGASWARAAIMREWAGEEWYLQIDSHQRFAQDWDATLLRQAELTGSPMPVLSAPAPQLTADGTRSGMPLRAEFAGFRADGIPDIRTGFLPSDVAEGGPVRARSICGHMLFAPGRFAKDVPYDPETYFSWEETTMSVRAFTHGYDLYHPTAVVTWHDYSRSGRAMHWDDHVESNGVVEPWHQLRQIGLAKVVQFFADPHVGPLGLGGARSLADFEAYAGVSFRQRRVQDYTRRADEPPNPPAEPEWPDKVRDHRIEVTVDLAQLPAAATADPTLWYVGFHDSEGAELYREDASRQELESLLSPDSPHVSLVREFSSIASPATWTVLPLSASAGWLEPVTQPIVLADRASVVS